MKVENRMECKLLVSGCSCAPKCPNENTICSVIYSNICSTFFAFSVNSLYYVALDAFFEKRQLENAITYIDSLFNLSLPYLFYHYFKIIIISN